MKVEKNNSNFYKSIIFSILLLITIDILFIIPENENLFEEPYDWGNRGDIPFKINECKSIFAENQGKLKIIVIGDSRGQQALWSQELDKKFDNQTITYNLCFAGTGALFQISLLQEIFLPQLQPDIVIWDLSFNDFGDTPVQNEQNRELFSLPRARYYTNYKINMTSEEQISYYLSKISRLYRYRSNFFPSVFRVESTKGENIAKYERTYQAGFLETEQIFISNETDIRNLTINSPLHNETMTKFQQIRQSLQTKGIYHLIVHPAHDHQIWINKELQSLFIEFGEDFFLDLNGDSRFVNHTLYSNKDHLNSNGASLYTNLIYEKIQVQVNLMLESIQEEN